LRSSSCSSLKAKFTARSPLLGVVCGDQFY
jgi:hypothetical protein